MGEGWTPEALAGVDFEHKLDERQSVFVSGEYLPSLSEIPGYRVNGKGGYKVVIDPSNKVTLEVGVADRYDSDPGAGRWRNDMEYFLTIGWEF
jgi:hypothetical protein